MGEALAGEDRYHAHGKKALGTHHEVRPVHARAQGNPGREEAGQRQDPRREQKPQAIPVGQDQGEGPPEEEP
jgi:hypothetical protein